jgi:hypothetical protein
MQPHVCEITMDSPFPAPLHLSATNSAATNCMNYSVGCNFGHPVGLSDSPTANTMLISAFPAYIKFGSGYTSKSDVDSVDFLLRLLPSYASQLPAWKKQMEELAPVVFEQLKQERILTYGTDKSSGEISYPSPSNDRTC